MLKERRFWSLCLTVALVGLNLIAFNLLSDRLLASRIDLTENQLYSISPATRQLLESLDDTVVLHGYFSKKIHPLLEPVVDEIVDMMEEYAAVSDGRVRVEVADPNEDEDARDEANSRFGVESIPFRMASKYETGVVNAFFAVVVEFGDQYERYGWEDLIRIDVGADGEPDVRLRGLEYDLTRAIKKVVFGLRGTGDLFAQIEEPVVMTAILTPNDLPDAFAEVPEKLRKAADELKEKSGGRFHYEELDPTGDEAMQEELRRKYGARPIQASFFDEGSFYLYALLQVGDRLEQIRIADPELTEAAVRESVEDALRRMAPGFLKTVGIVAPDGELPPEVLMQYQMQGRPPPQPPPEFQEIGNFLQRDYHVEDVDLEGAGGVPASVDTLLVIKPTGLSERAVFHLDQYLMRGGRVILCSGSFKASFDPSGLTSRPVDSGLDDWLAHFGLAVGKEMVLDDQNQPLPIPKMVSTSLGTMRTYEMEPYPYLVQVSGDGFIEQAVTSGLDAMGIYWGSPVTVDSEKTAELQTIELLQSSDKSWTSSDPTGVTRIGYEVPATGTEPKLLAVALSGRFESFFAGKEPPKAADEPPPFGEEEPEPEPSTEIVLEESPDTRLVLIGNSEFLSDMVASALSYIDGGFFYENLRFTQNLIDWANLDNQMISIRSHGAAVRRLDRLEPGEQKSIEALNYVIPVGIILFVGILRWTRRRQVRPVIAGRPARAPLGAVEEVAS